MENATIGFDIGFMILTIIFILVYWYFDDRKKKEKLKSENFDQKVYKPESP